MPNALREEFVNIGVVLRESGSGAASIRFAPDWTRGSSIDPTADTELLDALAGGPRPRRAEPSQRQGLIDLMEDTFSSTIRLSAKQPVLTDSPEKELRRVPRGGSVTLPSHGS